MSATSLDPSMQDRCQAQPWQAPAPATVSDTQGMSGGPDFRFLRKLVCKQPTLKAVAAPVAPTRTTLAAPMWQNKQQAACSNGPGAGRQKLMTVYRHACATIRVARCGWAFGAISRGVRMAGLVLLINSACTDLALHIPSRVCPALAFPDSGVTLGVCQGKVSIAECALALWTL